MPKQEDLNPLLKQLSKTILHTYDLPISLTELIASYKKSPYFKDIYKFVTKDYSPYKGSADTIFKKVCSDFATINGLLFKFVPLPYRDQPELLLCITEEYIPLVLYQYHDLVLAGHQGITTTYRTLQANYYFPHMLAYVKKYIQTCQRCQEKKPAQAQPAAIHIRVPINFRPFDHCSMDIKHMPQSGYGYKFLLICTCEVTNFVEAIALEDETARSIFNALFYKIVCRYGQPRLLVSDKGAGFTSKLMEYLYTRLRIRPYVINPMNKGSNKTERYIQTISNQIQKYLEGEGGEWPVYIAPCTYAMNTFISPATGFSPYEMVFGRKPPELTEIAAYVEEGIEVPPDDYVRKLRRQLAMIEKVVKDNKRAQQTTQKYREARAHPDYCTFGKDDYVMLKRPALADLRTKNRKFTRDWIGPLRIVGVLSEDKYLVTDWEGQIPAVAIGRKELKPYHFRFTPTTRLHEDITNAKEHFRQLVPILRQTSTDLQQAPPARVESQAT